MKKLNSFAEFSLAKTKVVAAQLEEEQNTKRSNEAETFTSLLADFGVTAIKELSEDQKVKFFEKLRGAGVNESIALIEEGTRGQFGKIDKKGNIESIYTHYDSYPENVLPFLKKGYKGGKNVDTVIKGGNSSGLENTPAEMNFYKDGSKNLKGTIADVKKYITDASNDGAEYVYLWDEANKEWLMADVYAGTELVAAFESLSVSVNESIKVEGKRDAKKVLTQYNNIFNKALVDFGAMPTESILGCIKYLMVEALGDANFHREAEPTGKMIKGSIKPLEIKMPGLGGHFIKIGPKTIKEILDKYYSDLANAAGWGGIGIVEGTALYLEQIKQEAMGQAALNKFNSIFEGVNEATVIMDATQPDDKDFLKFLKKNKVTIEILTMDGPSGFPEVELTGKRKDLENVLADDELGWDDAGLSEYIEESNGTATVKVKSLLEAKSLNVGDNGVDYNDNVVEIIAIGRFAKIAKMFKKETKEDAEDSGFKELMVNTDYYLTKNIESSEGNVGDFAMYPVRYDMANYWGLDPLDESVVTEAEIKTEDDFKEYAYGILKKAFADDFDQAKADDVVNGILSKADGDFGKAAGILQSSLA